MSEVGALIVKLQAETAQFREDLGKVKSDLDSVGDSGGRAGTGVSGGMFEARQSLMLVEESVGVRVPRALNQLLARIPGVSEAFTTMLPIFGIAVAIKIIGEMIDKQNALQEKQREMAGATTSMALGFDAETHSLQNANLKLDDQIARLEHKPSQNFLAEAINENIIAMDKWAQRSADDFQKEEKDLANYIGTWNILKNDGILGLGDFSGKLGRAVSDAALDVEKIGTHIAAVKTAMIGLAPGTQIYADKVHDLVGWYGQLQAAQEKGVTAAKAYGDTGVGALEAFQRGALESAQAVNSLSLEIEAAGKRVKVAHLEQGIANLEPLKDEAELQKIAAAGALQHSEALIKLARTQAETAVSANRGGGDNDVDANLARQKAAIEEEKNSSIAAANAELIAKLDTYGADIKAASDNAQKKKELNAQLANEVHANEDAIAQFNAEADKQIVAADAEAAAKRRQLAAELNKAMVSLAEQATKAEETAQLEDLKKYEDANSRKHTLGIESERQYTQAKIALTLQELAIKKHALETEIELQAAAADMANESGNKGAESEALQKQSQLQAQLNTLTKDYKSELHTLDTTMMQLNSSWSTYFGKMKTETMDLSTQIRVTLQKSVTEFENQFANSMAKCIVEGKNLGMAMRQEAEQMAESMISSLVKWLEQWIITHVMANVIGKSTGETQIAAASGLAGANMVASWAAAPFPIDALAPAMGAQAAAAALAFSAETGGVLPGTGPVPLLAHGGETIVTKALTDRVESAERNGGNGGEMHMHYSPTVHAMDAEGLDRVLQKHGSTFERTARNVARKRNK